MQIKVFYRSGRLDAFDTMAFCTAEPYRRQGDNLLTEFQLLTDSETLANEGLMLEVYWYDPRVREDTTCSGRYQLPHASRQAGNRIRLASKSELQDVAQITVDGELLIWRQGDHLINGVKFMNQEVLCYSSAVTASINRRALTLYDYLRNAHPSLSDEAVAALLGYPKGAIDDISCAEAANMDFADEELAPEAEPPAESWDFG